MNSEMTPRILRTQSCATEARQAVREFHAAVAQPDLALVLFFCSNAYDREELADEMQRVFAGTQVVGCTTAGEIGPAGCLEHSLTGASFPASSFNVVGGLIGDLQQFKEATGQAFARDLLQDLQGLAPQADADNSFGLLLVDGLSLREEPVTRALQSALRRIPLIGGSAGDGLEFGQTHVYFKGRFHADSAVLVLVTTPLPFRLFKVQHFLPTEQRLVVTAADARRRIVKEIDGWPAAEAYARLVGTDVRSLDPLRFAATPVVVLIDGSNYVRAIQKANPDGSLTFYCAIEEGVVLRVARGVDLAENLEHAFADMDAAIGTPQFVLGCDCILRKLEIVQAGLVDRVQAVFRANNVVGFNGYGEQYRGVHVNQTLTGIAIGEVVHA